MVLTTHAVVGGAIGRLFIAQPLLAVALAFGSHFVLDLIPHWDYPLAAKRRDAGEPYTFTLNRNWSLAVDLVRIAADLLLGLFLVYWFLPAPSGGGWAIWAGAAAAVAPDLLQFIYAVFRPRFLRGLQRFHHFIHAKKSLNDQPFSGVMLQVAIAAGAIVAVKFLVLPEWRLVVGQIWAIAKLKDLLDVVIVAVMIYLAIIFIRRTKSLFIVNGVLLLGGLYYLARYFDLALTRQAFQPVLTFFIVIFVIVFQREIRRFFDWLVHAQNWSDRGLPSFDILTILARGVGELARTRTGAIIVIPGEDPVDRLMEGGQMLDGRLSTPLLLSIFDTSSPGHDGAILLAGDRIKRFGVHLPLADNLAASGNFGTRHRAAVGVTERTDALAIVVSEERGTISVAEAGRLETITDTALLLERLKKFVRENIAEEAANIWHFLIIRNFWPKLSALLVAAGLWFALVFQIGIVNRDISVPLEFRFIPAGLSVSNLSANTVNVTVAGPNRDLLNLKTEQVKVLIDLSGAEAGVRQVTLTKTSVSLPPYLTFVDVKPERVSFQLKSINADRP